MTETATTDRRHIPDWLKDQDIWAVWTPEFGKTIMAPWATGHCYPASWGHDADERPETSFSKAKMVADLPPETVHDSWPFPANGDGPDIPESLYPTIILPHDPPDPPLMLVDLDDVRDPETGELSPAAARIVDDLDAYTEVSQSGTGLHLFVRAMLPGNHGKFIESLAHTESLGALSELHVSPDGSVVDVQPSTPEHWPSVGAEYPPGHPLAGDLELYDHGRVVGATWEHVAGTPYDVPERQGVIDGLVEEFEPADGGSATPEPDGGDDNSASPDDIDSTGDRSPYYDVGIRTIADGGVFSRYRDKSPGDDWNGPHPGHGPLHSDPDECTNFDVDTGSDRWYCFAHESGGKPLHLAAVLCPDTDVACSDVPSKAASRNWLEDRPIEMLRTCLWLRDKHAPADAKPPYAALVGVAKVVNLPTDTDDILGESTYSVARSIYDELDEGDI
jgi:hypothetical protein